MTRLTTKGTSLMTLSNSPDRNIGVQRNTNDSVDRRIGDQWNTIYTSEYISKLQIHQHSLLTRKVFSRHNLSSQVFFSVSSWSSSSHLHCQVIFIKSGSSLDHHQVWIITWSIASLDHHWIIIIITSSAISIKWCYLFILLVTGSSTDLVLFHVGCRPSLEVGIHILQHLYLTMRGTHTRTVSEWPSQHLHLSFSKNGSQL